MKYSLFCSDKNNELLKFKNETKHGNEISKAKQFLSKDFIYAFLYKSYKVHGFFRKKSIPIICTFVKHFK